MMNLAVLNSNKKELFPVPFFAFTIRFNYVIIIKIYLGDLL